MIHYQLIEKYESRICIVRSSTSSDELLVKFDNPDKHVESLKNLKTEQRKKDYLTIRFALKMLLQNEEKEIIYDEDGKPILKDESFKISFSHCKNYVAVISHPTNEVGIDIEGATKKLLTIYTRFLGEKELEIYDKTESFDFIRIAWSAKEALYKVIGKDAYNFAKQLQISPFDVKNEGELTVTHIKTQKKYTVYYTVNEEYTLAYTIDSN